MLLRYIEISIGTRQNIKLKHLM